MLAVKFTKLEIYCCTLHGEEGWGGGGGGEGGGGEGGGEGKMLRPSRGIGD